MKLPNGTYSTRASLCMVRVPTDRYSGCKTIDTGFNNVIITTNLLLLAGKPIESFRVSLVFPQKRHPQLSGSSKIHKGEKVHVLPESREATAAISCWCSNINLESANNTDLLVSNDVWDHNNCAKRAFWTAWSTSSFVFLRSVPRRPPVAGSKQVKNAGSFAYIFINTFRRYSSNKLE